MPDPQGFDDETIRHLGEGIFGHFADMYPFAGLSFSDRLRAITRHYGGQRPAARAFGVSDRTLRRWLTGQAKPKPANMDAAEHAYLRLHLQLNGFVPGSSVERRLAHEWSNGAGPIALGKIMEVILRILNAVPATLTVRSAVTFEPGMGRMWAADCSVSAGDARGRFPFNTGTYAA